jgi:hypothetical protein
MDQPLLNDAILIKREFLNLKSTYSQENKKYRNIVKELIDMGFELEMIDMCFCFFNIQSIEEAITYLTKDEGVWQHNYIESENKLCIICNENSDHINYHIYNSKKLERDSLNKKFSRHSFSSQNFSSPQHSVFDSRDADLIINFKRISSLKKQESGLTINSKKLSGLKNDHNDNVIEEVKENQMENVLCKVCEIESTIEDTFHLKCGHVFCKECWYFYLDQKISHSEVIN